MSDGRVSIQCTFWCPMVWIRRCGCSVCVGVEVLISAESTDEIFDRLDQSGRSVKWGLDLEPLRVSELNQRFLIYRRYHYLLDSLGHWIATNLWLANLRREWIWPCYLPGDSKGLSLNDYRDLGLSFRVNWFCGYLFGLMPHIAIQIF